MYSSKKEKDYHTCPYCGANLDYGEWCDCRASGESDNYQAVRIGGGIENHDKVKQQSEK